MLELHEFFCLTEFSHQALFVEELWKALFHLESYLKSFAHKIEIEIPEGVYLKNKEQISIGQGTVLEPGVYIEGPCIIGKNCKIAHGAYLRAKSILSDECKLGHCAEVKAAILLKKAVAGHFSYVGDSILGKGVNLGAGVKCANLRLDKREIELKIKGEILKTGLKKMGAIIGDGCQVGCNSVLNPGTLVAKNVLLPPLQSYSGWIHESFRLSKTH